VLQEETETKRTELLKRRLGIRRKERDDCRREMTPNKEELLERLADITNNTLIQLGRNTLSVTA
jgi:hypothetical protein